jgi:hypothetical protein
MFRFSFGASLQLNGNRRSSSWNGSGQSSRKRIGAAAFGLDGLLLPTDFWKLAATWTLV